MKHLISLSPYENKWARKPQNKPIATESRYSLAQGPQAMRWAIAKGKPHLWSHSLGLIECICFVRGVTPYPHLSLISLYYTFIYMLCLFPCAVLFCFPPFFYICSCFVGCSNCGIPMNRSCSVLPRFYLFIFCLFVCGGIWCEFEMWFLNVFFIIKIVFFVCLISLKEKPILRICSNKMC